MGSQQAVHLEGSHQQEEGSQLQGVDTPRVDQSQAEEEGHLVDSPVCVCVCVYLRCDSGPSLP